jgi:hypothetical protein
MYPFEEQQTKKGKCASSRLWIFQEFSRQNLFQKVVGRKGEIDHAEEKGKSFEVDCNSLHLYISQFIKDIDLF